MFAKNKFDLKKFVFQTANKSAFFLNKIVFRLKLLVFFDDGGRE